MAGRPNPRPKGALENEVVACLAAAGRPMTPGEVRAALGDDLAITTVTTTLARLHAKQALTRAPRGRGFAYELIGGPAESRARLTAREMQRLLAAGTDRATVLMRFVDSLDEDSEQILRDLLDGHDGHDDPAPPDLPDGDRGRR